MHAWGDIDQLVYPRSAIKALQALPLIESGAADHFALSDAELALACSSHHAEPTHCNAVSDWLHKVGLNADALECGEHEPLHAPCALTLHLQKRPSSRIHNNCSGKHSGMLTTAVHLGENTVGYIDREHPVQQRWIDAVGEMAGIDLHRLPWNYDGCGIPVIAMPLQATATAFARFAAADDLSKPRAEAIDRLAGAIASNPFMVAGSGGLCSEVMALTGRRIMVKTGADGVYTAAIPDLSLGIALKIEDGQSIAAKVAMLGVLTKLKLLHPDELELLADRCRVPIRNSRDVLTGHHQVAEALY
ncbi:MAG: L-asparaginase II [Planctomycetota bacterium]